MSWTEAFSRAFRAMLALVIIYITAIVLIVMGGGIIGGTDGEAGGIIFGGIFILAGIALIVLSVMAVFIKTITDAITDNQPAQIVVPAQTTVPAPQAQAISRGTGSAPSTSQSPKARAQRTTREIPSRDNLANRTSLRSLHSQIRDSRNSHPNNTRLREIHEDSLQTWQKLNNDAAYEGSPAFQLAFKRIQEAHQQFLAEHQSEE